MARETGRWMFPVPTPGDGLAPSPAAGKDAGAKQLADQGAGSGDERRLWHRGSSFHYSERKGASPASNPLLLAVSPCNDQDPEGFGERVVAQVEDDLLGGQWLEVSAVGGYAGERLPDGELVHLAGALIGEH